MSGQRFVYDSERQRHEKFVGRAELIARLDRLLVDPGADCWVVVTGGPGMGKSAILTTWLARREAAGAAVPHHFIRRGAYNWDDPSQLVSSLVAQLEERFELHEPEADERLHPAARLHRMLSRVSSHQLSQLLVHEPDLGLRACRAAGWIIDVHPALTLPGRAPSRR